MSASRLGDDAASALVAQLEADLVDSDTFWMKNGIDHENGGFMCALAHGTCVRVVLRPQISSRSFFGGLHNVAHPNC